MYEEDDEVIGCIFALCKISGSKKEIYINEMAVLPERQKGDGIMQFLIRAYDGEGKLDKRMEVRPRHLEGMKKLSEHIISAGGLLDDEGKMKGSALIMDFESRKELDDYIANEPYVVENVWEKIEIEPINVVIANGKE